AMGLVEGVVGIGDGPSHHRRLQAIIALDDLARLGAGRVVVIGDGLDRAAIGTDHRLVGAVVNAIAIGVIGDGDGAAVLRCRGDRLGLQDAIGIGIGLGLGLAAVIVEDG